MRARGGVGGGFSSLARRHQSLSRPMAADRITCLIIKCYIGNWLNNTASRANNNKGSTTLNGFPIAKWFSVEYNQARAALIKAWAQKGKHKMGCRECTCRLKGGRIASKTFKSPRLSKLRPVVSVLVFMLSIKTWQISADWSNKV